MLHLTIQPRLNLTILLLLLLLLFLFFSLQASALASESHIIETLPGYSGPLTFQLETGYIGVGEDEEEVQLFYYFVESEGNPDKDPLVLWLTGGPGCSGLSGLAYEIGPFGFDVASFDGSLPTLVTNPYSWTKVANIIFLDSPVGTGFSYAKTSHGYNSSDTMAVMHNYAFLKKWFLNHPRFMKNRLYIAGDSYGGKIVPMVAWEVAKGNEAGLERRMPLDGYFVGNPVMEEDTDRNEQVPYAHRMALISDEYFEQAKVYCDGEYVNVDPNNLLCNYALEIINGCTKGINEAYILDPKCKVFSPNPSNRRGKRAILEEDPHDFLSVLKREPSCRNDYTTSYLWANNSTVQESLYIRKGTIKEWKRCNQSLAYEYDTTSVLEYHRIMNEKGYQILAYSGDHDMIIPYMSTLKWIHGLNLTLDYKWRPWTVDGQVGGYTEKYKKGEAYITFATVKGAGHTVPEYMPKQSLAMVERWLSLSPL